RRSVWGSAEVHGSWIPAGGFVGLGVVGDGDAVEGFVEGFVDGFCECVFVGEGLVFALVLPLPFSSRNATTMIPTTRIPPPMNSSGRQLRGRRGCGGGGGCMGCTG